MLLDVASPFSAGPSAAIIGVIIILICIAVFGAVIISKEVKKRKAKSTCESKTNSEEIKK